MAPFPHAIVRQPCANRSGPRLGSHRHRLRTVPGPQPDVQCKQFIAKGYVIVRSPASRRGLRRVRSHYPSEKDSHLQMLAPLQSSTDRADCPVLDSAITLLYLVATGAAAGRRPVAADAAELASHHAHLYYSTADQFCARAQISSTISIIIKGA